MVEYDGSGFYGFQRQTTLMSVQGTIETAIATILGETVHLKTAGRTDAGVHARGIVVSFACSVDITEEIKFLLSLNGITARTKLSVQSIMKIDDAFHARFSCTEREYEYWIVNAPFRHILLEGRAFWVKGKIDLELVRENLCLLPGKHHFDSFTPPLSLMGRTSERKITEASITLSDDYTGLLKIRIRGTGFLHNMVRIISGTLIDIGRGRIKDRNMGDIIRARDRTLAGITLPPYGLYFMKAHYENYPEIERLYMKNSFI